MYGAPYMQQQQAYGMMQPQYAQPGPYGAQPPPYPPQGAPPMGVRSRSRFRFAASLARLADDVDHAPRAARRRRACRTVCRTRPCRTA